MGAREKRSREKISRSAPARRWPDEEPSAEAVPPVLILNPAAGRGRAAREWARVRDELRSWRTMPEVIETTHAGHGTELAKQAAAKGTSLVIAAGGDGSAHEVVQGLMEVDAGATGTAFAHLPLGTGCDLARGLGLPRDPCGILAGLAEGRHAHLDIGIADMSMGVDTVRRYFLNAATVGLGPTVARRVKASPQLQRFGRHAYTIASLQEIFTARPYQLSWRTDNGQEGDGLVLHMFINNGPSVAGGMVPSPQASFGNGELQVVIVGPLGLAAALLQFRRLDRKLPFTHPDIRSFPCRSIDLDGPEIEMETDGEIAAGLPARLSVRPGGLLVRLPA
ncbi:MAG: diacylglycerol kinase family lipid kinase [Acidobacteriota bacterium]|jgi:YegS/Rv2252/BmrU family lipid kinase